MVSSVFEYRVYRKHQASAISTKPRKSARRTPLSPMDSRVQKAHPVESTAWPQPWEPKMATAGSQEATVLPQLLLRGCIPLGLVEPASAMLLMCLRVATQLALLRAHYGKRAHCAQGTKHGAYSVALT